MESIQQTLRSYKNLAIKNSKAIAGLSRHVSMEKQLVTLPVSNSFAQIKNQYDLTLTASKASVERNIHLQEELQFKQQRLKSLRQHYYKHFQQIEGLQLEMRRAAARLKRERKNKQDLSQKILPNEKLKRQLERLNSKKSRLEQEEGQLQRKEELKRQAIAKMELQIAEAEIIGSQEQKAQSLRLKILQQEIFRHQSMVDALRIQNQEGITPQKPNRSIHLQQMIMKIRQQRDSLQD